MNMKIALALLAASGCVMSATGCHHHLRYDERVWNGWCGSGACDSICDSGCGKDGCKGCAQKASCAKCSVAHRKPLSKLHDYFWCAGGCGEVYVGEWISDPPECCDPCDAHFGCWTGHNDCCHRKIFDPVLWILKRKHKHCAPWWADHGIPSSGCHYIDCPRCHGCYPMVCGCGGCGDCCCEEPVGDDVPVPQNPDASPHPSDAIPIPIIGGAATSDRLATQPEQGETTNLLR